MITTETKCTHWVSTNLVGEPRRRTDYIGKVVILDFWYRGCGHCFLALPKVKALHAKYKDRGVVVMGAPMVPDAATPTRLHRRWLQFSIRTLLLFILLVATFCGGWVSHNEWLQRRMRRAHGDGFWARTSSSFGSSLPRDIEYFDDVEGRMVTGRELREEARETEAQEVRPARRAH